MLTPCSIFLKLMQTDEVDILAALTSLLKIMMETSSKPLNKWPTYTATIKKITCEDEAMVYQDQGIKKSLRHRATFRINHKTTTFELHNAYDLEWLGLTFS